jgi:hypothetical protein
MSRHVYDISLTTASQFSQAADPAVITKRMSAGRIRPSTAILIAAGAYFVISAWVPLGSTLLYPLTLFTTWVHEMGHGMSALIVGGDFSELVINANAGGTAWAGAAHGWPDALVAAGGLLAPPLLGAVILATVHGPRRARALLIFLVLAIVASLILYVRSTVGIVAMSAVAVALAWAAFGAFRENPERRVLVAQFLAVILGVDTLTRMVGYAFMGKLGSGQRSDVGHIADNLGGHHVLWGLAITAIALGALALGVWLAWRKAPSAP